MYSGVFSLKRLFHFPLCQFAACCLILSWFFIFPSHSFGQQNNARAIKQPRLAISSSTPVEDVIRIVLLSMTSDLTKFDKAFDRLAKETGGLSTHTYDAVDDAIQMLGRKAPRTRDGKLMKRVVVVVTDGFPVGDTVAPQTVIERANEAEVSVYSVTLPSFSSRSITTLHHYPHPLM